MYHLQKCVLQSFFVLKFYKGKVNCSTFLSQGLSENYCIEGLPFHVVLKYLAAYSFILSQSTRDRQAERRTDREYRQAKFPLHKQHRATGPGLQSL